MNDRRFPVEWTEVVDDLGAYFILHGLQRDGFDGVRGIVFGWSLGDHLPDPRETLVSGRYIFGWAEDRDIVHGPIKITPEDGLLCITSGLVEFRKLARELAHQREQDYDLG